MKKQNKSAALVCAALLTASAFGFSSCEGNKDISPIKAKLEGDYDVAITVNGNTSSKSTKISEDLFGIFLEDINYGVDGGLYAELVRNRSFEYAALAIDGHMNGWRADSGCEVTFVEDEKSAICSNNATYANLSVKEGVAGIRNIGFLSDSMAIREGEKYDFSVYMKSDKGYRGTLTLSFVDTVTGERIGEKRVAVEVSSEWAKYECVLTSSKTANENIGFQIEMEAGSLDIDMVSVIPQNNILNMRRDLVQALIDLNPRFLRFPGGCVVEGASLETMYDWKDSIGVDRETGKATSVTTTVVDLDSGKKESRTSTGGVETRALGINIWDTSNVNGPGFALQQGDKSENPYYMTYGIGFYEYLLLCEEMGIKAVPDVSVGMTCFARGSTYTVVSGSELDAYVQDALDFVAFCNGSVDSKDDNIAYWAQVRTDMGHPETFDLEYLEIGNEQFGEDFVKNYAKFQQAFEKVRRDAPEVYKNVQIIIPCGTDDTHTYAYDEIYDSGKGTEYATISDEHYYISPDSFYNIQKRYDSPAYDEYLKDGITVFLGEYAGRENTLNSAIAEAAFMTSLIRNGDVVQMASYAPLFARIKLSGTQWSAADMIWVTNQDCYYSPDYYIQQLFMNHFGTKVLATDSDVLDTTTNLKNIFHVASMDEEGNFYLILVNSFPYQMSTKISVGNVSLDSTAEVTVFNADGISKPDTKNSLTETNLYNSKYTMDVSESFDFTHPAYSAAAFKLSTTK